MRSVFIRDGFIDRYSATELAFPVRFGSFRALCRKTFLLNQTGTPAKTR